MHSQKMCEKPNGGVYFQNLLVEDGNDLQAIGEAIEKAKGKILPRPSFITIKTDRLRLSGKSKGKASAQETVRGGKC